MGGYGSTRWGWHQKRRQVESCLVLDVGRFMKHVIPSQILARQIDWEGQIIWNNVSSASQIASVGYAIHWKNSLPELVLRYTVGQKYHSHSKPEEKKYPVRMVQTQPHYGGLRWWFTCPLILNSHPCHRRVGKLYLPPSSLFFGCRHCYQLTYKSAQEAHSLDRRTDYFGQSLFLLERIRRVEERMNRYSRWSPKKEKLLDAYMRLVEQFDSTSDSPFLELTPGLITETENLASITADLDSLLRSINLADDEFLASMDTDLQRLLEDL